LVERKIEVDVDLRTRILLTTSTIIFVLGILLLLETRNFGKLRLIFCDVGQGDGMLLISPSGKQVVVDGGPGTKIVDCLSQKMPFWDRTIEMVILTHGEKDHLEGLLEVLARYQVKTIVQTGITKETELYKAWEGSVAGEKAKVEIVHAGVEIVVDRARLKVLWPEKLDQDIWRKSPPESLNETSIVLKLSYGEFCAYLTGDTDKEILEEIIEGQCAVLKVAHHGSRTGTNKEILEKIAPRVAIVQVGKNSYGHPHKEVLDLLTSKGLKILRNDTNGIIEVGSDGGGFRVKSER
jgi:competence protein ComEC